MRVITLEEHFASPMQIEATKHQPKTVFTERGAHVGHDIQAELYDIGARRIAAMDAAAQWSLVGVAVGAALSTSSRH